MNVTVSKLTIGRVCIALLVLLIGDAIWFQYSTVHIYPSLTNVRIGWGLIAWVALAVGVASANPNSVKSAIGWGAAVGFITYAVFNGTELAIRPDWTPFMAMSDWTWGTFICSVSSLGLYLYHNKNK